MFFLFAILYPLSSFADQQKTFRPGMQAGRGINSLSGEIKGSCVELSNLGDFQGGQNVKLSIEKIESKNELREKMGLEAEASLSTFASGKIDYFKSQEINQYSLYILVSVIIRNSQQLMDINTVKLKEDSAELLTQGNKKRFIERCGDSFINGIISGGEFFSIYEIKTSSKEEREELDASVSASYGIFGGSAKFKSALQKVSKIATTNIVVHREGDRGTEIPQSPDDILDYAVNFPSIINNPNNAVNYKVITLGYETLPMAEGDLSTDFSFIKNKIKELSSINNKFEDSIRNINYVLDNPNQFIKFDQEKFDEIVNLSNNLELARLKIIEKSIFCFNREREKCLSDFSPPLPNPNIRNALPEQVLSSLIEKKHEIDCKKFRNTQYNGIISLKTYRDKIAILYRDSGYKRLSKKSESSGNRPPSYIVGSSRGTGRIIGGCALIFDKMIRNVSDRNCYSLHKLKYYDPVIGGRIKYDLESKKCISYDNRN